MVSLEELQKIFRGRIGISEPLAKFTTFRIGGPADYYLEPMDKEDVLAVIRYFQEQNFPYMIIGRGSNLLIHDEGYRGAAINFEAGLSKMTLENNGIIRAEAGERLSTFVDFCIQQGYGGTEMLAGIPGTLGGAIVMNAGAYGGEISDYLIDVEVIRNGKQARIKKEDAGFSYRNSGFRRDVVLEARFKMPKRDKNELMRIRRELLIKRNKAQPVHQPNAGSMFKNPEGNFAAKLIEEAGLKGMVIGGAQISGQHANFIVNVHQAKADDVFELLCLARQTVYQKFNVLLETEVKLIGFGDEQLKRLKERPQRQTQNI